MLERTVIAAAAEVPTGPSAAARRRRTVVVMAGTASVLGLASLVVGALAVPALAVAAVTVGYVAAGAIARRRRVRLEVARAFAAPGGGFDWAALAGLGTPDELPAATPRAGSRRELWAFVGASLLGWALTPIVTVARLASGDRRDLEGDGALARLVALQRDGRTHSLRALAISLATTAGVGAAGTMSGALGAGVAAAAPAPGTVTVVRGDTLASIALLHSTTVAALVAANHLPDPDLVYVGQVLALPGGASVSRAGAPQSGGTQSGGPQARGPQAGAPAAASHAYVVRPGDTLSGIAASHATTVAAIVAANHIADPDVIAVGAVLQVPGAGVRPVLVPAVARAAAARSAASAAAARPAAPVATPTASTPAAPAAATSGATASPAASSGVAASTAAATALRVALEQVGKPYRWAGAGPADFDCSGLVMYAYAAAGVALPHNAASQYDATSRIAEADLEPGDLVFWGGSDPYHVAMYDGGGQIVVADTTGTDVRVEAMTWDGTPSGFGRVG